MVEYVGIPYVEIIKHAFLPATISYIALLYIVHLEALKLGMQPIGDHQPKPWLRRLTGFAFGAALISGLSMAVYYGLGWLCRRWATMPCPASPCCWPPPIWGC